jgi:hypothetical protein
MRQQPGQVHRDRYNRFKRLNRSPEEIAAEDNVAVSTVQKSIERVQIEESMTTYADMERTQIGIITAVADLEKAALMGALTATVPVSITDSNGKTKIIQKADIDTQTRAIEVITARISAIKPKIVGGGNQTQINIKAGDVTASSASGVNYNSFEERLRTHLQNRTRPALPAKTEDTQQIIESVPGGHDADLIE